MKIVFMLVSLLFFSNAYADQGDNCQKAAETKCEVSFRCISVNYECVLEDGFQTFGYTIKEELNCVAPNGKVSIINRLLPPDVFHSAGSDLGRCQERMNRFVSQYGKCL